MNTFLNKSILMVAVLQISTLSNAFAQQSQSSGYVNPPQQGGVEYVQPVAPPYPYGYPYGYYPNENPFPNQSEEDRIYQQNKHPGEL